MQGFRKVDPDRWEFANEYFLRGRRDQLNDIHRRKPTGGERARSGGHHHDAQHTAIEVGQFGGLQQEVETLQRDKNVLMQEVIRLRQAQQEQSEEIADLRDAVELSTQRQQQMIAFLASALQHPALVQHFVSSTPTIKRLEDGRRRKKRKGSSGVGGDSDSDGQESPAPEAAQQLMPYQPQQCLSDLASAFMNLLSTQAAPAGGRRGARAEQAAQQGPIIQEPAGSGSGGLGGLPAIPPVAPAMTPGGPMVLGSLPSGPGQHAAGAPLDSFVPLPGTTLPENGSQGPTITELPELDKFTLDDVDLDNLSDILPSMAPLVSGRRGLARPWAGQPWARSLLLGRC